MLSVNAMFGDYRSASARSPGGSQGVARNGEAMLEGPRSKYPKLPFLRQTQPWPGLARDMEKSDHGEHSKRYVLHGLLFSSPR